MSRVNWTWTCAMPMLWVAAMLVGGCGNELGDPGNQDPGGTPQPAPQEQNPAGIWKYESGPFASYFDDRNTWEGRYLILNPDGTGRITTQETTIGALYCSDVSYTTIDDVLLFSFYQDEEWIFGESSFLIFNLPDDNTLVLDSGLGEKTTFSRQQAVPNDMDCGEMEMVREFTGLNILPHYQSGLAYDGTILWFTDDDDRLVYPINPDTGALGAPLDFATSKYVQASSDDNLWAFDGDDKAFLRTKTTEVIETVDLPADLALDYEIESMAYDPATTRLWMHGEYEGDRFDYDTLIEINVAGEPDVLVKNVTFDLYINSMTWDGEHLWMLVDDYPQSIYKVDTESFKVVKTFRLEPRYDVYFQGIAAVGDTFFLIGTDYLDYTGVLAEFKPAD